MREYWFLCSAVLSSCSLMCCWFNRWPCVFSAYKRMNVLSESVGSGRSIYAWIISATRQVTGRERKRETLKLRSRFRALSQSKLAWRASCGAVWVMKVFVCGGLDPPKAFQPLNQQLAFFAPSLRTPPVTWSEESNQAVERFLSSRVSFCWRFSQLVPHP